MGLPLSGKDRKERHESIFPSSYPHAALASDSVMFPLLFSHMSKPGWPQTLRHFSPAKGAPYQQPSAAQLGSYTAAPDSKSGLPIGDWSLGSPETPQRSLSFSLSSSLFLCYQISSGRYAHLLEEQSDPKGAFLSSSHGCFYLNLHFLFLLFPASSSSTYADFKGSCWCWASRAHRGLRSDMGWRVSPQDPLLLLPLLFQFISRRQQSRSYSGSHFPCLQQSSTFHICFQYQRSAEWGSSVPSETGISECPEFTFSHFRVTTDCSTVEMGKMVTAVTFHAKIYGFAQLSNRMWRKVKKCSTKCERCESCFSLVQN